MIMREFAAAAGGKAAAGAAGAAGASRAGSWEYAHASLVWKDVIGAGGFGTVYEVAHGGLAMAAKKIVITVAAERESAVRMVRRELRALQPLRATLRGTCSVRTASGVLGFQNPPPRASSA